MGLTDKLDILMKERNINKAELAESQVYHIQLLMVSIRRDQKTLNFLP